MKIYRRKLQIGVVGSMADLNYSVKLENIAYKLGKTIALNGNILVFGAEKDSDSLPTQAALGARSVGGITVGITYEKGLSIFNQESATIVVTTGLVRGGGREMVQSLSCDGLIAISGGSGTLNEISVAYQDNIPVVVMQKTGGWSEKLQNSYLDARKRYKFASASTPEVALDKLIKMIEFSKGK